MDNDSGHYTPSNSALYKTALNLIKKHGENIFSKNAEIGFYKQDGVMTTCSLHEFLSMGNSLPKKADTFSLSQVLTLSKYLSVEDLANIELEFSEQDANMRKFALLPPGKYSFNQVTDAVKELTEKMASECVRGNETNVSKR
jgi:hypothetical protein